MRDLVRSQKATEFGQCFKYFFHNLVNFFGRSCRDALQNLTFDACSRRLESRLCPINARNALLSMPAECILFTIDHYS